MESPIKEIALANGTRILVFQGNRGAKPELDIIVRYKEAGKKVRTPQHLHWAIDLLIKREHEKGLTLEFVEFLMGMWGRVEPFGTKEEQQMCELKASERAALEKFRQLDKYGEYSVEFIASVLELIMRQEKTGNAKAFMFGDLLRAIYDGKDIFSVVASAEYGGRRKRDK